MILESTQSFGNYDEEGERYECRVCLQPIAALTHHYCECRGNHRNIHENCLKEWAKRTQKFKDQHSNGVYFFCDLCKSRIYLQLTRSCKCRNSSQIASECKQGSGKILLTIILFVVFLCIFLICLSILKGNDAPVIVIILTVFSSVVVVFSLPLLAIRVALTCRYEIDGFRHLSKVISNAQVNNSNISLVE